MNPYFNGRDPIWSQSVICQEAAEQFRAEEGMAREGVPISFAAGRGPEIPLEWRERIHAFLKQCAAAAGVSDIRVALGLPASARIWNCLRKLKRDGLVTRTSKDRYQAC